MNERVVACGAGFAGDRTEPAVALAASGRVHAVALECLAERTLVPGLRARRSDPQAGADPRLRRRLRPLLPVARANGCRVISNLGAANPRAAGLQIARLAGACGCSGLRVAAVLGDDVMALAAQVEWQEPFSGELLGAHAYLGADALREAVVEGADVIVTGRVADSALFSAELLPILLDEADALAGATTVGHLLECSGQVTGGNFEMPDGDSLSAREFAELGFPLARVFADGSAEIGLLDGASGRVDALTCTLQLLYEVHDPGSYITPDVILDFTGVKFEQIGRNLVRMSGARARGRPRKLKVSGFVEQPGFVADVEIGYAGTHALQRGRIAADALRLRLDDWQPEDLRIDLVGVDSTLGPASLPAPNRAPEVRVHVSARCADAEMAQIVEDEVYSLTLSGPAGGGSVRSERRPSLAVVDGLIPRELVRTETVWEQAP
ncbi:MAG: DUF1446 domain-containing protein [Alphaproteobacteria bacterium]|nr:DUF1446 domain-containing protein [Alphaproteobacteria bacterium]